ncbi:hypothetical protein SAMN05216299_1032 [Nitrosospira sp. Nsp14]|nr:hypothetical protein SAMN05216299_1032 [Nitrosospira sp. Nsp14]
MIPLIHQATWYRYQRKPHKQAFAPLIPLIPGNTSVQKLWCQIKEQHRSGGGFITPKAIRRKLPIVPQLLMQRQCLGNQMQ